MRRQRARRALLRHTALVAIGLLWACDGGEDGPLSQAQAQADTYEAVPAPPATPTWEPGALRTVRATPAEGRTGPGGQPFETTRRIDDVATHLTRQIGTRTFEIAMRSAGRSQPACSSCHLAGGRIVTEDRTADAHADIQPVHPTELGPTCITCHAAEDPERLALRGGGRTTLDEAYRLCAQCHFAQVESWAGGAHGKRLDGWQGRRVIMNCADCHDPHNPSIEQRIPFPGPRIPRSGHSP
jgi:hypothetical protein